MRTDPQLEPDLHALSRDELIPRLERALQELKMLKWCIAWQHGGSYTIRFSTLVAANPTRITVRTCFQPEDGAYLIQADKDYDRSPTERP